MTRQDYQAMAALIRVQRPERGWLDDAVNNALDELARDMAQYMASQNPRFSTDQFLAAAGVA